ncbi:39S ribosomal protein L47, mitochondrial [Contarinia nasturtii]|uniref:39S ribosomal protein L47, mitochondrial n=1 Tax=Contarinia nasturtii TaxID=265458 RepID=UPI0012D3B78E|nr:39S ribosomal protein L47, mitochondrial [Contarinia nasturtii]
MSSIQGILNRSKDIRLLCSRLTNLNITKNIVHNNFLCPQNGNQLSLLTANFHTTIQRYDLMEFFDDKKNWGANEVRSGRSWRLDELRIKSNSDLHKLWYVLLKEKNMLLTMEHEADEKFELFPSPERIDKVEESMENIETVVRERNRAYHLLETGQDGERPARVETNQLGLRYFYRTREYFIPQKYSRKKRFFNPYRVDRDVSTFLRFYRERLAKMKYRAKNRDKNYVTKLLSRYPNLDRKLVQREYPYVDVKAIDYKDKSRGHFAPKID